MRSTAAVVALGLILPTAALSAPIKLTHAQLDLVCAGVSATIDASGAALGSTTRTGTDTSTKVLGGPFVSVAFGRGVAFAAGSDSADSSVDVSGEGDRVRMHTRGGTFETPKATVSHSLGFVLAIEKRVAR